MSKSVVVSGYATLDYAVHTPRPVHGPGTTAVTAMARGRWPQPGGAAFYSSLRLAAAGHQAIPLLTLGEDANGESYFAACQAANVSTAGIVRVGEARTPWCMLLYHDDGSCTCLLDYGAVDSRPLNVRQLSLATRADLVCIAAGPALASEQLLDQLPDSVPLAWIAKNDPRCFPDALCARLARRADLIFCNSSERELVEAARTAGTRTNQSIVETRGSRGVIVDTANGRVELTSDPLQAGDTTGAGDTLAGETLAALLSGETSLVAAVQKGANAARALLQSRL